MTDKILEFEINPRLKQFYMHRHRTEFCCTHRIYRIKLTNMTPAILFLS